MKITGTTFGHKVIEHDYCLAQSVQSMLGVCDEVLIADCGGGDGTSELIEGLADKDNRISVFRHPWEPSHRGKWLADIENFLRSKADKRSYHLHVQADEVIHEHSYPEIREFAKKNVCALVRRYNFWKDHRHLAPRGTVCGSYIIRMAPMSAPAWGDGENLKDVEDKPFNSTVELFHYGFIREIQAFRKKALMMEVNYFNQVNKVWDRVAEEGERPIKEYYTDQELQPYTGTHPAVAIPWLKAHGYE